MERLPGHREASGGKMMYSLVIAEDELATRRGLVNMIKWDELGFQVDGVFSDG